MPRHTDSPVCASKVCVVVVVVDGGGAGDVGRTRGFGDWLELVASARFK